LRAAESPFGTRGARFRRLGGRAVTENLCADVRLALGALALGALEPAEGQEIRDHLAACPACAAEARSMEETAAVLALVDGAAVGANDVDPSPGLLDRLLADVGRQRWRR